MRWAVGLALVAVGCCFVPMVGRVGFEFSLVMAPLLAIAAADLGIHATGLRTATRRALCIAIPPLLIVALNGVRMKVCDWGTSVGFYLLLPGVAAVIGAAWGRAGALLAGPGRPGRARAWVIAAGAVSLGLAAWRLAMTPPIFSYDPVFGMWPGALYDEALGLPPPLAPARLMHLLAAWCGLGIAHLIRTPAEHRAAPSAWAPALALSVAVCLLLGAAPRLGFRHDRSSIEAALGRTQQPEPGLTVLSDRRIPSEEIDALIADIAWRRVEIAEALEWSVDRWPPLEVYVFRTSAQRRRLMGADRTAVARPWLGHVYLVRPDPGEILVAHELVHALAGALTSNPSGMPWLGVGPAMGLVEGLAVALAGRDTGPALHEAVAGMRAVGLSPSPEDLLTSAGFYALPASRAYAVAGSYVLFLLERYGPTAVRTAYASGRTPPGLQAQWEEMIGRLEVSEELKARSQLLYRRAAVYRRVCPHEVAVRKKEARRLRGFDAEGAVDAWRSIVGWDPGDPGHLLGLARAHLHAGDLPAAAEAAKLCGEHDNAPEAMRRSASLTQADIAWLTGSPESRHDAHLQYRAAAGKVGRASSERLVRAKSQATAPARSGGDGVRDWLLGRSDAEPGLLALQRLVIEDRWGLPAYLVGRRMYGDDAWAEATSWFQEARKLGLGDPLLAAENLRLLGRAAYRAGQPAIAAEAFEALEAAAPSSGYGQGARSWRHRLVWLQEEAPRGRNVPASTDVGEQ